MLQPPTLGDAARSAFTLSPPWLRLMASMAARRTISDPWFGMEPRRTFVSDSRWRSVSPAHEHK